MKIYTYEPQLGAEHLCIKWVPQGEQFEITEYDGSEGLNIIGQCQYLIA